jgi:hypothetical protein
MCATLHFARVLINSYKLLFDHRRQRDPSVRMFVIDNELLKGSFIHDIRFTSNPNFTAPRVQLEFVTGLISNKLEHGK